MEALALEGRLVSIAFIAGSIKAHINIFTMMQKRLTLTGSTLRARSVAEKGAIAAGLMAHVWPLFEARTIAPVIHATFPLRDAAAAHRVMEAGAHIGKLVLVV
jgi:NADPH:quinone reductase-like Zn-dependent oxidoreductase